MGTETETLNRTSVDNKSEFSLEGSDNGVPSSDIIKIPITVDENNVIDGAREILKVVRPSWSCDNIKFKLFTDGITNKLVGCFHMPSASSPQFTQIKANSMADGNQKTKSSNDVVLVRVYGNKTDLLIDRKAEQKNIQFLQSYSFAPQLYAVFHNGLAYEYVPGCTLTPASVTTPRIWKLIAKHMARMHRIRHTNELLKNSTEPMLWKKIQKFINLIPETFTNLKIHERVKPLFLPIQRVKNEIEELRQHLVPLNSPIVFCHNDLLLGNVIFTEFANKVTFIDFEYAAYNYQAFDIGNHFTEFAGIDNIDYSRYPSKEFQYDWLRVYLEEYSSDLSVKNEDIHQLYVQVNKFALASHLFWCIWALIQAEHSTIDFDFVKFATDRYNEYLNRKETFFALK